MTVYTSFIQLALVLIAKWGKTVTLHQGVTTPTDANKPWRGAAALGANCAPKGFVSAFEKEEIDGSRITNSDLKLLVAAGDAAFLSPAFDGTTVVAATVDGVVYGAECIYPLKPGDELVLLTYRLRKDGT